jgi:hypothetical protein
MMKTAGERLQRRLIPIEPADPRHGLASCVIATAIGTLLEISSQSLMPMNDVAEAGSQC